jgi:hypothetical protein
MNAFTIPYGKRLLTIITQAGVGVGQSMNVSNTLPLNGVRALWDTGATGSVISKKIASSLKLFPIGISQVTGINGIMESKKYVVDIFLPNNVRILDVMVTECDSEYWDILIGMDIIGLCDFCITHSDGTTLFTFQTPSTHKIDFVAELNHLIEQKKNEDIHNKMKSKINRGHLTKGKRK